MTAPVTDPTTGEAVVDPAAPLAQIAERAQPIYRTRRASIYPRMSQPPAERLPSGGGYFGVDPVKLRYHGQRLTSLRGSYRSVAAVIRIAESLCNIRVRHDLDTRDDDVYEMGRDMVDIAARVERGEQVDFGSMALPVRRPSIRPGQLNAAPVATPGSFVSLAGLVPVRSDEVGSAPVAPGPLTGGGASPLGPGNDDLLYASADGQTIDDVAGLLGVSPAALVSANPALAFLPAGTALTPGTLIAIPGRDDEDEAPAGPGALFDNQDVELPSPVPNVHASISDEGTHLIVTTAAVAGRIVERVQVFAEGAQIWNGSAPGTQSIPLGLPGGFHEISSTYTFDDGTTETVTATVWVPFDLVEPPLSAEVTSPVHLRVIAHNPRDEDPVEASIVLNGEVIRSTTNLAEHNLGRWFSESDASVVPPGESEIEVIYTYADGTTETLTTTVWRDPGDFGGPQVEASVSDSLLLAVNVTSPDRAAETYTLLLNGQEYELNNSSGEVDFYLYPDLNPGWQEFQVEVQYADGTSTIVESRVWVEPALLPEADVGLIDNPLLGRAQHATTVEELAERWNVLAITLRLLNPWIGEDGQILEGQLLQMPGEHIVLAGQSLNDIAATYNITAGMLIGLNNDAISNGPIQVGQRLIVPGWDHRAGGPPTIVDVVDRIPPALGTALEAVADGLTINLSGVNLRAELAVTAEFFVNGVRDSALYNVGSHPWTDTINPASLRPGVNEVTVVYTYADGTTMTETTLVQIDPSLFPDAAVTSEIGEHGIILSAPAPDDRIVTDVTVEAWGGEVNFAYTIDIDEHLAGDVVADPNNLLVPWDLVTPGGNELQVTFTFIDGSTETVGVIVWIPDEVYLVPDVGLIDNALFTSIRTVMRPMEAVAEIAAGFPSVTEELLLLLNPWLLDVDWVVTGQMVQLSGEHVVLPGQSLDDIAATFGISVDLLLELNQDRLDPNNPLIAPTDVLIVPGWQPGTAPPVMVDVLDTFAPAANGLSVEFMASDATLDLTGWNPRYGDSADRLEIMVNGVLAIELDFVVDRLNVQGVPTDSLRPGANEVSVVYHYPDGTTEVITTEVWVDPALFGSLEVTAELDGDRLLVQAPSPEMRTIEHVTILVDGISTEFERSGFDNYYLDVDLNPGWHDVVVEVVYADGGVERTTVQVFQAAPVVVPGPIGDPDEPPVGSVIGASDAEQLEIVANGATIVVDLPPALDDVVVRVAILVNGVQVLTGEYAGQSVQLDNAPLVAGDNVVTTIYTMADGTEYSASSVVSIDASALPSRPEPGPPPTVWVDVIDTVTVRHQSNQAVLSVSTVLPNGHYVLAEAADLADGSFNINPILLGEGTHTLLLSYTMADGHVHVVEQVVTVPSDLAEPVGGFDVGVYVPSSTAAISAISIGAFQRGTNLEIDWEAVGAPPVQTTVSWNGNVHHGVPDGSLLIPLNELHDGQEITVTTVYADGSVLEQFVQVSGVAFSAPHVPGGGVVAVSGTNAVTGTNPPVGVADAQPIAEAVAEPYTVVLGDTFYDIAVRNGFTQEELEAVNTHIPDFRFIVAGETIVFIPKVAGGSLVAASGSTYLIQPGDTLTKIADAADVTVGQIMAANPKIIDPDVIYAGDVIVIPSGNAVAISPYPPPQAGTTYTILSGDTLSSIAQRVGVSLQALINANPQIANPDLIFAGHSLNIPGTGQEPPAANPGAPISAGAAAGFNYTIQTGDTLWNIAQNSGTTVGAIVAANPSITDPDRIAAGAVIFIPAPGSVTPTSELSVRPGGTVIIPSNGPDLDRPVFPVVGVSLRPEDKDDFGPRIHPIYGDWRMHNGVDIGAPIGTPLVSAYAGKVVVAVANGADNGGAGNYVVIDHGGGIVTRYLHMHDVGVQVGDVVNAGQQIGTVGNTGASTGPHLHFEIRIDNVAVDPYPYLEQASDDHAYLQPAVVVANVGGGTTREIVPGMTINTDLLPVIGFNPSAYRNDTEVLQRALEVLGYSIAVDGLFGPQTQDRLETFQQSQGLNPSGITDAATWTALVNRLLSAGDAGFLVLAEMWALDADPGGSGSSSSPGSSSGSTQPTRSEIFEQIDAQRQLLIATTNEIVRLEMVEAILASIDDLFSGAEAALHEETMRLLVSDGWPAEAAYYLTLAFTDSGQYTPSEILSMLSGREDEYASLSGTPQARAQRMYIESVDYTPPPGTPFEQIVATLDELAAIYASPLVSPLAGFEDARSLAVEEVLNGLFLIVTNGNTTAALAAELMVRDNGVAVAVAVDIANVWTALNPGLLALEIKNAFDNVAVRQEFNARGAGAAFEVAFPMASAGERLYVLFDRLDLYLNGPDGNPGANPNSGIDLSNATALSGQFFDLEQLVSRDRFTFPPTLAVADIVARVREQYGNRNDLNAELSGIVDSFFELAAAFEADWQAHNQARFNALRTNPASLANDALADGIAYLNQILDVSSTGVVGTPQLPRFGLHASLTQDAIDLLGELKTLQLERFIEAGGLASPPPLIDLLAIVYPGRPVPQVVSAAGAGGAVATHAERAARALAYLLDDEFRSVLRSLVPGIRPGAPIEYWMLPAVLDLPSTSNLGTINGEYTTALETLMPEGSSYTALEVLLAVEGIVNYPAVFGLLAGAATGTDVLRLGFTPPGGVMDLEALDTQVHPLDSITEGDIDGFYASMSQRPVLFNDIAAIDSIANGELDQTLSRQDFVDYVAGAGLPVALEEQLRVAIQNGLADRGGWETVLAIVQTAGLVVGVTGLLIAPMAPAAALALGVVGAGLAGVELAATLLIGDDEGAIWAALGLALSASDIVSAAKLGRSTLKTTFASKGVDLTDQAADEIIGVILNMEDLFPTATATQLLDDYGPVVFDTVLSDIAGLRSTMAQADDTLANLKELRSASEAIAARGTADSDLSRLIDDLFDDAARRADLTPFNATTSAGYLDAVTDADKLAYLAEYERQLAAQQEALSQLTAREYLEARENYREFGRQDFTGPQKTAARDAWVEAELQARLQDVIDAEADRLGRPLSPEEQEQLTIELEGKLRDEAADLVVLHDPDGVAGGWGTQGDPPQLGDRRVNSSIGAQWTSSGRLTEMDAAAAAMIAAGRGNETMNVTIGLL